MASTFQIKRNDRRPLLVATLTDTNDAVDLTNATAVRFHMYREDTRAEKVNAAATITTAASGIVTYAWAAGDTDTAGRYLAEWEVTWSDGTESTHPNTEFDTVIVHDDLS